MPPGTLYKLNHNTMQLQLFGSELRDEGIKQAIEHANSKTEGWAEKAYNFLLLFIKCNPEFLTEDVRRCSTGIVPEPPSRRAWGGIVVRAAKNGIIESIGYRPVRNPKAHRTPATLWRVKQSNNQTNG